MTTSSYKFQKSVLDSGLTLLTEYIPFYRSIAVGVWIKSGSRFETKENIGIAHFIEHMLFKRTESRSAFQIARTIEDLGGSINAFTGKEETCFFIHILDAHLDTAIELLGDMVCKSVFDKNDIDIEKQVVTEEIKALKDTPDEYVFDLYHENIFPDNPLGYPILGKMKDVKGITRNKILEFYNNHYTSDNIVIAIAGNVDHDLAYTLIDRFFNLSTGPLNKTFKTTNPVNCVNKIIRTNLNQAHICVGSEGVHYTHQEKYNLIALNTYLGSGLSSRLFQVLREELGLVYSIYSFLDFFMDTGIIGFYLGTDPANKSDAIACLKNEIDKVNNEKLSPEQVIKLREQLKGNYFLAMESTFKRMTRIAKNEMYHGKQISEEEIISHIEKITRESICEAANIYLNSSKLNTIILSPEKN